MTKEMQEKIDQATSRHYKAIFPETLNSQKTLFGGKVLEWMDEIAFITATRFCRKKIITYRINDVSFLKPIQEGSIIEITGQITEVRATRIIVNVAIYQESAYHQDRIKSMEAFFVMIAVDKNFKPVPVRHNGFNSGSADNSFLSNGTSHQEYQ